MDGGPIPLRERNEGQKSFPTSSSQTRASSASKLSSPVIINENLRSSSVSSARSHTIYVTGLKDERSKKLVGDCLLGVKGVVSFIIDLNEQKVVVRSMTSLDNILQAIFSNTGMRTSTTVDGDDDDDDNEGDEENKENNLDYLPEVKQDANTKGRGWFGAIISLSDAKKEKEKGASGGWFSKLGKALNIY